MASSSSSTVPNSALLNGSIRLLKVPVSFPSLAFSSSSIPNCFSSRQLDHELDVTWGVAERSCRGVGRTHDHAGVPTVINHVYFCMETSQRSQVPVPVFRFQLQAASKSVNFFEA